MFDKFSRSWSLAGQCWSVLKEEPALLVFPLMSSIALLLLLGSFAVPVFVIYHSADPALIRGDGSHFGRLPFYIATYIFYVVSYTVMMFFNTALIRVALKRLNGESAGVREGLQAAVDNLPAIVGYAFVAATVGTILRAIEERVGFIGRIVVSLIGAGWTLATAMVLPVLIEERIGPIDAISRSLTLLRHNWGENLIGNVGISLGIAVIAVPVLLVALFILFSAISAGTVAATVMGAVLLVLTTIIIGLVSTTLHTIYTAALYRFATGAKENAGIDGALLAAAFRPK